MLVGIVGVALVALILWDTFETVVLPRRVTRRIRLTRLFFRGTWKVWRLAAARIRRPARRENFLGLYGPISLLLLLATWAASLVLGFALVHTGLGMRLAIPEGRPTFFSALYFSGATLFTLGLGDVVPTSFASRVVTVVEAFVGFAFLALVIGYLPVVYQAFSRREGHIAMLDEWAGSPPTSSELLRRLAGWKDLDELPQFLATWEQWAAELLESHISYPVLARFRSQHGNESWLASLTTILDTCALVLSGLDGVRPRQAWLTFAMARHVAVDLCQVLDTPPRAPEKDRLPPDDLRRLRAVLLEAGAVLRTDDAADRTLAELRHSYEPYVTAIAGGLLLTLPTWLPVVTARDNWQKTAWTT
jgi:putative Mn2+ efflux pump MntP